MRGKKARLGRQRPAFIGFGAVQRVRRAVSDGSRSGRPSPLPRGQGGLLPPSGRKNAKGSCSESVRERELGFSERQGGDGRGGKARVGSVGPVPGRPAPPVHPSSWVPDVLHASPWGAKRRVSRAVSRRQAKAECCLPTSTPRRRAGGGGVVRSATHPSDARLTPSDPRLPSHLAGSDDLDQTGSSAAGTSSSSRRRSNVRSVGGLEGAKLLSAHVRPITCRTDQPRPTRADARAGQQASQLTVRSNTPDQPVQEQAMLTDTGTGGRRRGRVASRDRPPV